ncbi:c-type cytochrome [Yeosuana marina]|uniref:c-type cytochrome n=1 Tax=Yeosuana marina TaxID=1565536 RepID=UPI001423985B|nr:c-type cytochrome [Yeosuana marina]
MRKTLPYLYLFITVLFLSCGGKEKKKKEGFTYEKIQSDTKQSNNNVKTLASEKVDLKNKGIGPISELKLPENIDQNLAKNGEAIFKKMCTACHRPDKKFIGPAPKGILKTRTPEWIMNMILNPEEMLRKDPLAKELLAEFNYAPMIKQDISESDARAILEYYRTLD